MRKLPRVRVVYSFFRNPEWEAYRQAGGEWNGPEEPAFYVPKETLAEVLVWNINSGTIRVRILNEDGTVYKDGRAVTFDCPDDVLLVTHNTFKEAVYA